MEIKVVRDILEANEQDAGRVQERLKENTSFMINVMGSPGSGKTTLISALVKALAPLKTGVVEGDIETTTDAKTMADLGVPVVQINTGPFGGDCHLEAGWINTAMDDLPMAELDFVMVENIGNLVCPAEFELGDDISICVLSIPEGSDKPLKYPLMFRKADILVLSKSAVMDAFEYSLDTLRANLETVNGALPVFLTDAKSGEGMAELAAEIRERFKTKYHA